MARQGRISREFHNGARTILADARTERPIVLAGSEPDFLIFRSATNIGDTALDVLRPILMGDQVTVVTGYESLLSVLSMIAYLRPSIALAERDTIRILLGGRDRSNDRVPFAASLTPERLREYFVRDAGVSMSDPRDIHSLALMDALVSQAVRVRIFDPTEAKDVEFKEMKGILANMAVSEDFASASTAGFSRKDLFDRAIMIDRVASNTDAYGARAAAAEAFWKNGRNCNTETLEILKSLVAPVDPREAIVKALRALNNYPLFSSEDNDLNRIERELVGQALARVYENGYAFVNVPSGISQAEMSAHIEDALRLNAARFFGSGEKGGPRHRWAAHVETAGAARWQQEKILRVLARNAPLVLDGSVPPKAGESEVEAVFRRLRCRHLLTPHGKGRAIEGVGSLPEIKGDVRAVEFSKGQISGVSALSEEIASMSADALDEQSVNSLSFLSKVLEESVDAGLLIWQQGGMAGRVRVMRKGGGAPKDEPQGFLPMLAAEDDGVDDGWEDKIGEMLTSRSLRSIDKTRVTAMMGVLEHHRQVLCLVENPIARHALARRAVEQTEASVLAVIPETSLRDVRIPSRDATYQRAESAEIAMTMLESADENPPALILASAAQAAQMNLPRATACVVLSIGGDFDQLVGALSAIDGFGKDSPNILVSILDHGDGWFGGREAGVALSSLEAQTAAATAQMRRLTTEQKDGVADILNDIANRAGFSEEDCKDPLSKSIAVATFESEDMFTFVVLAGSSDDPDAAPVPPRLLLVRRDPETGEERIIRNQVACADFLASWTREVGVKKRDRDAPPPKVGLGDLDIIGRHLSHLIHWDARPERLVRLLETLAEFISDGQRSDAELFSDLCLTSLNVIGARWETHLLESRRIGLVTEPGLAEAYRALKERAPWEREDIRQEMRMLIDRRLVIDSGRSKAMHDRIVAVLHGDGTASLSA